MMLDSSNPAASAGKTTRTIPGERVTCVAKSNPAASFDAAGG
jgi:hypothetical protein